MTGKSHARVVNEEKVSVGSKQLAVSNDELTGEQLATGNGQWAIDDKQHTMDSQISNSKSQIPNHTKIAIFASGAGSNAKKIIDHFRNTDTVSIALIVCNKPGAGVLTIAKQEGIPYILIDKEKFFRGNAYVNELKVAGIGFIVLAGFLWKIPPALINAFANKIINIHPALLPKYGGKGMYGHTVHEVVITAGETESGISIHYVDELYDHGRTIFQITCPVLPGDTADTLAKRVLELEHEHYPRVIEECLETTK